VPTILLKTQIQAPPELVFDLSRDIDFHQSSLAHTQEIAIAGCTSGLIGLGESVTWEGRHFGFKQRLEVKITAMDRPHSFVDEMVKGAFKGFRHVHRFQAHEGGTLMTDEFIFTSPLGILGKLANALVLTRYMTRLLTIRNQHLKTAAEGNQNSQNLQNSQNV
jgi:ligand-binding SRPBCC domain-containing protein